MRISIITLTIDTPEYFDEAVGSIDRGEHSDLEHIVVHDGDEAFVASLGQRYPGIERAQGMLDERHLSQAWCVSMSWPGWQRRERFQAKGE